MYTTYNVTDYRRALSNNVNDLFDKVFTDFFKDDFFKTGFSVKQGTFPKCNVSLTDKELIIEAALPGYSKEDIKVTYKDDTLRITGSTNNKKTDGADHYLMREVKMSSFSRDFSVTSDAFDIDNITTSLINGILTIKILRFNDKEESTIREIDIT